MRRVFAGTIRLCGPSFLVLVSLSSSLCAFLGCLVALASFCIFQSPAQPRAAQSTPKEAITHHPDPPLTFPPFQLGLFFYLKLGRGHADMATTRRKATRATLRWCPSCHVKKNPFETFVDNWPFSSRHNESGSPGDSVRWGRARSSCFSVFLERFVLAGVSCDRNGRHC